MNKQINKSILIIVMAMFLIGLVSGGNSNVFSNIKSPVVPTTITENITIDDVGQEDQRMKALPFVIPLGLITFGFCYWLIKQRMSYDSRV